jgi:hypothetical protein
MPQDEFRIFLAAVSSEFGKARDAVAADLRSREALLSDITLKRLHDYIRDCSAVVCVVGKRSGSLPKPKEADPFAHMRRSGITKASYTLRSPFQTAQAAPLDLHRQLSARSLRTDRQGRS